MNCNNSFRDGGDLAITIKRIGAKGTDVPYQLWGVIDGVHQIGQEGILQGYNPATGADDLDAGDKKSFFDRATGDLLILDTSGTNDVGVRISCKKIPLKTLYKHLENQAKSSEVGFLLNNTQLSYGSEKSLAEDLIVQDRGIFSERTQTAITPRTFFDKEQQQSSLIDITDVIELMPSTRIDSIMTSDEDELTFNFTLLKV